MPDIAVLSGYFVRCPLGGYGWQILHYLMGLRACGLEPYFYEDTAHYPDCFDPVTGNMCSGPEAGLKIAEQFLGRYGFGDRWIFHDALGGGYYGRSQADSEAILGNARVLISLAAVNRLPRSVGRRRLFVDIDPGVTQTQAESDATMRAILLEHDAHFTVGENIGRPACAIPLAGFTWHPTRPPVATALWEPLPVAPDAAFTTIGRWDERRREVAVDGVLYSWRKRVEWLRFVRLPRLTGTPFRVAMDVDTMPGDRAVLEEHGWAIEDPLAVSRDPETYRQFIRASRGEFTVAKDLNVRLSTGWFSDRSVCYLAAGRPVVTQDTGFGRNIPTGRGLFAYRTEEEAAAAVAAVVADFDTHAGAARAVAESHFEARAVVRDMLDRAGV